jgi:hypothetical protein
MLAISSPLAHLVRGQRYQRQMLCARCNEDFVAFLFLSNESFVTPVATVFRMAVGV